MNAAMTALRRVTGAAAPAPLLRIEGRCLLEAGREFPCRATAISMNRAVLAAVASVKIGEQATLYLDNIGILTGHVEVKSEGGFTLCYEVPVDRAMRIKSRIDWHYRAAWSEPDQRSTARIVPDKRDVVVRLGEGLPFPGTILDMSISGAAIAMDGWLRPFEGSLVKVGSRFATVVRLTDTGIAVQFQEPLDPATCDRHVQL